MRGPTLRSDGQNSGEGHSTFRQQEECFQFRSPPPGVLKPSYEGLTLDTNIQHLKRLDTLGVTRCYLSNDLSLEEILALQASVAPKALIRVPSGFSK